MKKHQLPVAILSISAALAIGCSSSDERLVNLSRESNARQAEQNRQIAQQSQETAQATNNLIQADAQSRHEFIEAQTNLQKDLQVERHSLDRQHEGLEDERRQISADRQRDPIIAAAIISAATLLACALPIALCFVVLRALSHRSTDEALGELLAQEFVSDRPVLLPPAPPPVAVLEHRPAEPAIDSAHDGNDGTR